MGQSRESGCPDKDDRNTTGGPTRERPPNGPRSMREVDDSPMTDVSISARMFKLSGYATLTSGGHKRNLSEVAAAIADFAIATERSRHFACIATGPLITASVILVWQAVRGLSGRGPEGEARNSNHRAEVPGRGQGRSPARNMWRNNEYLR